MSPRYSYVAQGAIVQPPGHRRYSGLARSRSADNQADLIPRVMAERRRRALYAGCDRAPAGWEHRK